MAKTESEVGIAKPSRADAVVEFGVAHRRTGKMVVVEVVGELDMFTAPRLRDALALLVDGQDSPERLVIDLAGVTFMDSTGFLALDEGTSRNGWRGYTELRNLTPQVQRVIDLLSAWKTSTMRTG